MTSPKIYAKLLNDARHSKAYYLFGDKKIIKDINVFQYGTEDSPGNTLAFTFKIDIRDLSGYQRNILYELLDDEEVESYKKRFSE